MKICRAPLCAGSALRASLVLADERLAALSAEQKTALTRFVAMLDGVRRWFRQRRFYPAQRVTAYLS